MITRVFRYILVLFLSLFIFNSFGISKIQAQEKTKDIKFLTYFTGIGCPHCAKTDPVIFEDILPNNPDIAIIEYEIYQDKENAPILDNYLSNFDLGKSGIPLLIFPDKTYLKGDSPILSEAKNKIENIEANKIVLNDKVTNFKDLNINALPGQPKIWFQNKVLFKQNNLKSETIDQNNWIFGYNNLDIFDKKDVSTVNNDYLLLNRLIFENNIKDLKYSALGSQKLSLSGKTIEFQKSIEMAFPQDANSPTKPVTLGKVISLSLVDSINPCALAVLFLILLTIMIYNPGNKKIVLLSGLSFIAAIFLMYFAYGLVIVKLFQFLSMLTIVKLWIYKVLAIAAIILGLLNLKDFIRYKPGCFMTEMPMGYRGTVSKMISRATSPGGSFVIGLIVTLFLLPCTIGPYVIAGGFLSSLNWYEIFGWLGLYNLIFIIPMLIIIFIVFLGFKNVKDISKFKDDNIRWIHLATSVILIGLGILMLLGSI